MLCDINPNIGSATGMDLSDEMLNIGREKIKRFNGKIELHNGDAVQLPIENSQYDALTMSFGIRNVPDVPASMREMYRVLGEGGKALIFEILFTEKSNRSIRTPILFALRIAFGGWAHFRRLRCVQVSQHEYRGISLWEDFCNLMREAGFESVTAHPVTFGIATIYESLQTTCTRSLIRRMNGASKICQYHMVILSMRIKYPTRNFVGRCFELVSAG